MSLPKEPRQLMINLMYLVLTALLAMNVSREVINAFNIVDDSIQTSNAKIEDKNKATIINFEDVLDDPENKLTPEKRMKIEKAKAVADQARTMTNTMITQLKAYRQLLVDGADGIDPETGRMKREDDLESPTRIMIEEKNGTKMYTELNTFKKQLGDLVNKLEDGMAISAKKGVDFSESLPIDFKLNGKDVPGAEDWTYGNFNMVPAVAATTIVDKYINDVKNSESVVLDELWASAMGEKKQKKLVFTDFGVLLSANSNYILPGEKYSAEIMLGAYNKKGQAGLKINVNGQSMAIKDGIATYTTTASGAGEKSVVVSASYYDENENRTVTIPPRTYKYYVGDPQASISLDKMNVFYMGVDNPITLSASGFSSGSINPVAGPNINIKSTGETGKYIVTIDKFGGESSISLVGKMNDGGTKTFGPFKYRLKRIPDPVAYVAGKHGGNVPVNEFKQQIAILAKLENFDFDAKFNVTSFEMFHVPRRGESPPPANCTNMYLDNRASPAVQAIMKNLNVGDKIILENIKAIGPDKTSRNLGSLVFTFPN